MSRGPTSPHVHRACPVCGETGSHSVFSQTFDQLSEAFLLDHYEVVICDRCGAGFADGIPPQSVFDDYYRELSKYEYEYSGGMPPEEDRLRSRQIAGSITDYILATDSCILEIGCANGVLLDCLKEQGFSNVHGVDPSPGCARAAKELFGIPVRAHSIFNIPSDQRFDFLILAGVLEHIRDLDLAAQKLHDLLLVNGRVYLAVPDAASFPAIKDAPFQEFSVEHINFFSTTSLTNFMQLRGFRFLGHGRLWLEPSPATNCVAIFCVFENAATSNAQLSLDRETEPGLREYIRRCRALDTSIQIQLAKIAESGKPILVWGTGAHTLRLLADGALNAVSIAAFVDSNPKYQAQELHGRPVLSPRQLHDRGEPILISSYAAQKAIARQIREELRLTNEIVTLYQI
jgi:SAM-dependent methyltransferase